MTEKEFNAINDDTLLVHMKYGRNYKVRDKHLRMKNPTTGEWVDSVTYIPQYPNPEKLFCRERKSFIEEFEVYDKLMGLIEQDPI